MTRHRYLNNELRRSQSTIWYPIDSLTGEERRQLGIVDLYTQFYPAMLIEDVSLWVAPQLLRRDRGAKAVLEPANPAAEELVGQALKLEYYGRDLGGAVYDFFHRCSATIAIHSQAPYELAYFHPQDCDTVVGFELFPIHPSTLLIEDGQLVQYVP